MSHIKGFFFFFFIWQICVEQCPTKFMTLVKALQDEKERDYYKRFCKEGVDMTKVSYVQKGTFFLSWIPSKNYYILENMIMIDNIFFILPLSFDTVV